MNVWVCGCKQEQPRHTSIPHLVSVVYGCMGVWVCTCVGVLVYVYGCVRVYVCMCVGVWVCGCKQEQPRHTSISHRMPPPPSPSLSRRHSLLLLLLLLRCPLRLT